MKWVKEWDSVVFGTPSTAKSEASRSKSKPVVFTVKQIPEYANAAVVSVCGVDVVGLAGLDTRARSVSCPAGRGRTFSSEPTTTRGRMRS